MKIKLNDELEIDLPTLIDTRLLVQANSGGGKSWVIRRILEQSHGHVQHIILDLEGEFSTLREKYDYVLAAADGDMSVDLKSASLFAKKLLELNVSAIIDLYDLSHQDRKEYVKRFLTGMMNAPKKLRHPCIVVIDEAHVFCPEKGQSVAAEAVIDLMTRGRKRGYCGILATQRLSKLHKDAAAEANNKLIGRTGLDVDMKRASEELGFSSKEQYRSLRDLQAGEFFVFGPAISREVLKIKIGTVETTHPKAGSRIIAETTPPTEKIKKLLNQLGDLPAAAREEEQTIESLTAEVKRLRKQPVTMNAHFAATVTPEMIQKAVEPHLTAFRSVEGALEKKIKDWKIYAEKLLLTVINSADSLQRITPPDDSIGVRYIPIKIKEKDEMIEKAREESFVTEPVKPTKGSELLKEIIGNPIKTGAGPYEHNFSISTDDKPLGIGEKKILTAIAQAVNGITRKHLTVLTGYKRSSRDTYIQRLKQKDLIEIHGDKLFAQPAGIETLGSDYSPLPTGQALIDHLLTTLPEGEKKILDLLITEHRQGRFLTRDLISEVTGYQRSSRDTYLQRLKSRDLIIVEGKNIKVSGDLFV